MGPIYTKQLASWSLLNWGEMFLDLRSFEASASLTDPNLFREIHVPSPAPNTVPCIGTSFPKKFRKSTQRYGLFQKTQSKQHESHGVFCCLGDSPFKKTSKTNNSRDFLEKTTALLTTPSSPPQQDSSTTNQPPPTRVPSQSHRLR